MEARLWEGRAGGRIAPPVETPDDPEHPSPELAGHLARYLVGQGSLAD